MDETEDMIRRERIAKAAPTDGLFGNAFTPCATCHRDIPTCTARRMCWLDPRMNYETPIGGLFDLCYPAPSVPVDTSEAAADALSFTPAGKARRRKAQLTVLAILASRDGATIDEIDALTGYGTGTICPRVDELRTAEWIKTTTETRRTRKGSNARVHVITALGRLKLAAAV